MVTVEPGAETEICGNVNDPSGNYNLGIVSPLATTVRITTRTLKSVTAGKGKLTVKWNGSKVFTGYEVQYADNERFDNAVTVTIDDKGTYQTVLNGLTSGTTCYVRIRSYHEFNEMTYYGAWSDILNATVR